MCPEYIRVLISQFIRKYIIRKYSGKFQCAERIESKRYTGTGLFEMAILITCCIQQYFLQPIIWEVCDGLVTQHATTPLYEPKVDTVDWISYFGISIRQSYPMTGLEKPLGLQEIGAPGISRQSANEDGKVVHYRHWPPLPTRKHPWYPFLLEAESKPRPQWCRKD
jgi:hypothetical protein